MEALFLKVLNMSITAGYVILAVLLLRPALARAPKKYSYLLWAVVLFRLTCPVSFSSVFSLFRTGLFDMTTAQKNGGAALDYIPANIGYMQTPRVTVGIPTMNSILSESLPAAAPYASVNPLQLWMLLGTVLWCAGLIALLAYGILTTLRLKRRVATAVLLRDNVYESDRIRSPFVLGLARPRIYIPFGLGERERAYILRHEACHIRRGDHLIKPLCFLVLAVHWFNPLVLLAFVLMSRDMEMSCDERVLSETGAGIAADYSASLLSLASNRRFPGSLAFGETGIRARIKNILRFKEPKRWAAVAAAVLCMTAAAACAANPIKSAGQQEENGIYGSYVFEQSVYMNPLSSFMPFEGYKQYYTLTESALILTDEAGYRQVVPAAAEQSEVDEQPFRDSFMMEGFGVPDISSYQERTQYTLTDASGSPVFRLYLLEGEIWLARIHRDNVNTQKSEYIWSIYQITPYDGEIPLRTAVYGTQDGVDAFLSLQKDYSSGYEEDTCYNITPDDIRGSGYQIFKYDASCASFLLYEGAVYPLGEWFGGCGVTSMALADLNGDQAPELYYTYSWGSGLHRSLAAYFDPAAMQSVAFDYTHMNEDMLVTGNGGGGLSLYAASVADSEDFAHFDLVGGALLSDIVYENGQITLAPAEAQ